MLFMCLVHGFTAGSSPLYNCPPSLCLPFWLENEHNNLMNQISKDLTDYYLVREFGSMKRKDEELIPTGEVRVRPIKEIKRTKTRVAKK